MFSQGQNLQSKQHHMDTTISKMFQRLPVRNSMILTKTSYLSHRPPDKKDACQLPKVVSAKCGKEQRVVKIKLEGRMKAARVKKLAAAARRKEPCQQQALLALQIIRPPDSNAGTEKHNNCHSWSRRRRNHAMDSDMLQELLKLALLEERQAVLPITAPTSVL
jgi:hypothetical protein